MEKTMYEVGVVAHFEAEHSLAGDFGPATRQHEHTYRVEAVVTGPTLSADGTLFDISILQRAVEEITTGLHYQDLNELPAFQQRNSTAEVVAEFVFGQIAPTLRDRGLAALQVRVWESPGAFGGYEGSLM
jgi:6-pyruvoyltetrahydropterin/6-carboxytetrahydropterin synthase